MQTVKGVKVRCIKLLKNKVYKFARYSYTPGRIYSIINKRSTLKLFYILIRYSFATSTGRNNNQSVHLSLTNYKMVFFVIYQEGK